MAEKKKSAYGVPAGDTDFRKTYDLDEYAARASAREAAEREERKARYEAAVAGKRYHKPATGTESLSTARGTTLDARALVGTVQLAPAGSGTTRRGRGPGFYCEHCDLTFKDNMAFVEHRNTRSHLSNAGLLAEVARAGAAEVRAAIDAAWERVQKERQGRAATLGERLAVRKEEEALEREERARRKAAAREKKKAERERIEAESKKVDYGDDVRVEGEHSEDDMMAAMGITAFGGTKKK